MSSSLDCPSIRFHWGLIGGLLVLFLAGCGQTDLPAGSPPSLAVLTPARSPVTSPTVVIEPTTTPTLDLTWVKSTQVAYESETHMARIATEVAQGTVLALTPTTPTTPLPTVPPNPTPGLIDMPLGILGPAKLGFHLCDCSIENEWRGRLRDGDYIEVYSGSWWHWVEANSGLLVVEERTPNYLGSYGFHFYDTPMPTGSVHIVSYNNLKLTLLSADNTQFIFDVGTRTWFPPPTIAAPIPTSMPQHN